MGKRLNSLLLCARTFLGSRRGNVAMMFALAFVPVTIAAGVGLDFARAMMVRSAMSEALDAAALAVGSTTGLNHDTAQTLAQKFFAANYKGDPSYGTPVVTIGANDYASTGSVKLSVSDSMPTTLMGVAGIHTVPVTSSSTVVWGQSKLWVSLVLDNTGSMCEPDANPCPGDTKTTIKINALKTATIQLLGILQNAASNPGDIKVSIVPFNQDVKWGTGMASSSWISWTDWASAPANAGTLPNTLGPGDNCPWSTNSKGFNCTASSANGDSSVSSIPSSGWICPSYDRGTVNSGRTGRYYNGCYSSDPSTSNSTGNATTKTVCSSSTSCTKAKYCGGYPSSSSSSSGHSTTVTTTTCSCTTTSKPSCTTVATPVTTTTTYSHTWTPNSHSSWSGCIMDRDQDADTYDSSSNNAGYPAVNSVSNNTCTTATVMGLSSTWTDLTAKVNSMVAGGGTNQTVGLANGMETLSPSGPFPAGALPANTTRYMIILSDGLNTIDRWYGDGVNQSTQVNDRMALACTHAKAEGIVVYSIFVDLNGTQGNSQVLSDCATDSTKYFDLTTSGAIITTFNQIAQQITNVRVSK